MVKPIPSMRRSLRLVAGVMLWAGISQCATAASQDVFGRVVDTRGQPVVRALVGEVPLGRFCADPHLGTRDNLLVADGDYSMWASVPSQPAESETNDDGRFRVAAVQSAAIIVATKAGYAPAVVRCRANTSCEIQLTSGVNVELRVRASGGAEGGVERAVVEMVPLSLCAAALTARAGVFVRTAVMDTDGFLTFSHIGPGVYAFRILASGRAVTGVGPITVGDRDVRLTARLPAGVTLSVKLGRPEGTHDAGRVLVSWRTGDGEVDWARASFGRDAESVTVEGLPVRRELQLAIQTESGLSSRVVEIPADHGSALDEPVALFRPQTLRGSLVSTPEQRSVWVEYASSEIIATAARSPEWLSLAPDGTFEIPRIPAVVSKVRLQIPNRKPVEASVEPTREVRFEHLEPKEPTQTLRGRVLADDLKYLVNPNITLRGARGVCCHAPVARDGSFVCELASEKPVRGRIDARGVTELGILPSREGEFQWGLSEPLQKSIVLDDGSSAVSVVLDTETEDGSANVQTFGGNTGGVIGLSPDRIGTPLKACEPSAFGPVGCVRDSARAVDSELPIRVSRAAAAFGEVSSLDLSQGVAGAEVSIGREQSGGPSASLALTIRTDSVGAWRAEGLTDGSFIVSARADGYSEAEGRVVLDRRKPSHVSLALVRPGDIQGRIRGGMFGKAVPTVSAVAIDRTRLSYHAEADSQGAFLIRGVAPGSYLVTARSELDDGSTQSRTSKTDVYPGKPSILEFDFQQGIALRGVVTLAHKVFGPGALTIEPIPANPGAASIATIDADGHYSVAVPVIGTYQAKLSRANSDFRGQSTVEFKVESETAQERDLDFAAGELSGKCLVKGDRPQPGRLIRLWLIDAQSSEGTAGSAKGAKSLAQLQTDEAGAFDFPGLGQGNYRVECSAPGFGSKSSGTQLLEESAQHVLPDLVLESGVKFLADVKGPSGEPISGAMVGLVANGDLGAGGALPNGITDSVGHVEIAGATPGTYSLIALFAGLAPILIDGITVEETDQSNVRSVQFPQAGTLQIQVIGSDGSPQPNVRPTIRYSTGRDLTRLYENLALISRSPVTTGEDGRLTIPFMAPGQYSVGVGTSGEDVIVQPGAGSVVVIRVAK